MKTKYLNTKLNKFVEMIEENKLTLFIKRKILFKVKSIIKRIESINQLK